MTKTYDFIVVGGGTSGSLLAHTLSSTLTSPRILLLEAGGTPSGPYLHAPSHRFAAPFARPDLDHGYASEPEPALNNRTIAYARGKGLGGCSLSNFGVYLYGSNEDYERWAELVGDAEWNWSHVRERFHAMEKYDAAGTNGYAHLADANAAKHGKDGRLGVGLPPVLERGVEAQMDALLEAGEVVNLDPNDGDVLGVSVFPMSYAKSGRTTSAGAFLQDSPSNLEIWTDAKVAKLVFEGNMVVGVETEDGRKATCTKEVILTAGAIDTPKLLLLNGIGPKSELEALGITVKHDLPGVGKRLSDHVLAFHTVEVDGAINDRTTFESDTAALELAAAHWDQDQSGAFALHHSTLYGGFHKLPGLEDSKDYQDLPDDVREFLAKDKVPHYEFVSNGLLYPPGTPITPGNSYMTFIAVLLNPQSEGSVTLRSSDAADKPVIQLNYMTHPYDRIAFRQAIRATWEKIVENPGIKPHVRKTLLGPKSLSDADIDAFIGDNAATVWHANGTVRMGECVDSAGRVYGVKGLRVADLSVCPVVTNNHTQSTAYLVGATVAGKVVAEYGLDGN